MTTVGDDFPKQQARCRELLAQYRAIGPGGFFGLALLESVLRNADEASISGDPVAILKAYAAMKECE